MARRSPARTRYPSSVQGETVYAIGEFTAAPIACVGRTPSFHCAHLAGRSRGKGAERSLYRRLLFDRGPDSKGVIDLLIARSEAARIVALRGNHEIMLESFLRGLTSSRIRRRFGGLETVLSYGVEAKLLLERGDIRPRDLAEKIPASHLRFLSSLKGIHKSGRYCFAHAGIRPGLALEQQTIEDTAWIREDFLNHPGSFGLVVVHGHSPVADVEFHPNRINI